MWPKPTAEGKIPFRIPSVNEPCFTYYKIFGDLSEGIPLICVHGGPGAGHNYLLAFSSLWESFRIPVIFYDGFGCGQSTHLRDTTGDPSILQMPLLIDELDNLIDHFGLRPGGFHLFGHSLGGMIVPTFATTRPRGLQRLVIASGAPSREHMDASFAEVLAELPDEHRLAVEGAVRDGDYKSPAYAQAMLHFRRTYLLRMEQPPLERVESEKYQADDDTTRLAILGTSPWARDGGALDNWTCVPGLPHITAPTLVYNGEFDTNARDVSQRPFFELIPRVRWVTFPDAGHMVHFQTPELQRKVLRLVGSFLSSSDLDETSRG